MKTPDEKYKAPQTCGLGKSGIEQLSERFANQFGYQPGGDLDAIVSRVNGRIQYQDLWELDSSDSGSILVEPDHSFVISVANHTARTRDRFTIAHELGHYILHFLLPSVRGEMKDCGLKAARYGSGQTEFEANWFAAALLMPKATFAEQFKLHGGDLVDVADFFGVSVSAAAVRVAQLGLKN